MKGKRFRSFEKEFQILADTLPMLVSVTKNPDDETEEQFIITHDHFITLDETIKDKLASPETANRIQSIGKTYNLTLVQVSDIARAIRSYYFNEIRLEDFPQVLAREIPIDINKSQAIAQQVIQQIIKDDSQEKAYQASLVNMILTDAIKKYPQLGEQLITSQHIRIQNFPEPVRPSIKNWLSDYTFNVGFDSHASIVRGNYLFQNPNARVLAEGDREKLSYILKAFDEKIPVTININTKQIVFPEVRQSADRQFENPKSEIRNPKQYQNSNFQNSNPNELRGPTPNRPGSFEVGPQKSFSQTFNKPAKVDFRPTPKDRQSIGASPEYRFFTHHQPASSPEPPATSFQPAPPSFQPKPQSFQPKPPIQPIKQASITPAQPSPWKGEGGRYSPANLPAGPMNINHTNHITHPFEDDKIDFSSTHKLPYEHEREVAVQPLEPQHIQPQPLNPQPAQPQPMRITSSSKREEEESLPRNVVNLKE